MKKELELLYSKAIKHQKEHMCTAVPYDQGELLTTLVTALAPNRVLEVGTGTGYSTACISVGNDKTLIDTIEERGTHGDLAKEQWQYLNIASRINLFLDKAEVVLPTLTGPYDLIFFDGKAPSIKFLPHFQRVLRKGGVLLSANVFLKDPMGGVYLRQLQKSKHWQSTILHESVLSVKD